MPSAPNGNIYNVDLYLCDAEGNEIDDDDADPDWDKKALKMSWNTTNVKKGTYYVKICNNSDSLFTSNLSVGLKVPATKVKVNKTKVTLKKKKSFQIKASLSPSSSTDSLKYKTSNKKVAMVSKSGKITAKKKGKAVITVIATSGKKAKINVIVK